MATANRPDILLLSLEHESYLDDMYASLIDGLSQSANLKRTKTASATLNYLNTNNPRLIIITDQGLTIAKNKPVLEKVLSYLHETGGLVIVGLAFPSFTNRDAFDRFFGAFGLPWKAGDYHRTDFQFNAACALPAGAVSSTFPAPYSMKVLHIQHARPEEKIFVPVPEALTQSHVVTPEYVDQTQAAVVAAKVGRGDLVYVGDVNAEEGSARVILSLCGF